MSPFLLAALLLAAASSSDAGSWVVDRLEVALPEMSSQKSSDTGGRRAITDSELDFEARVAMIRQGATLAATRPMSEDVLASTLSYVIGQNLALLEIQRLKIDEPEDAEVAKERDAFANRFPTPSTYQAFLKRYDPTDYHVGEEALTAILRRELRVARYFDRRVRLLVRVDEADVKKYISEHPEAVAALDKQAAIDAVRARLTQERALEITRREMTAIRERHRFEVQLIGPIAQHLRDAESGSTRDGGTP